MNTKRDPFFDGLKFLLISLVIIGHIPFPSHGFHQVIYSFHMPMFAFLSGFFSKPQTLSGLFYSCLRLLRIYVIFDVILIAIQLFINDKPMSLRHLIVPQLAMWYLLSLIYWRIAISIKPLSELTTKQIIIITIITTIAGFIPLGSEFAFQRSIAFFPFFLYGYYSKRKGLIMKLRDNNKIKILLACIIFLACALITRQIHTFMPKNPYHSYNDMLIRIFQSGLAFIIIHAILTIIPNRFVLQFSKYGKNTIFYYTYHTIPVALIYVYLDKNNLSFNFITGILTAVVLLLLLTLISKIKLFQIPFK